MILILSPRFGWAQQVANSDSPQLSASLTPLEFGYRFGDNVFQSPDPSTRLSDEIYLLNGGGQAHSTWGLIQADLGYHLGVDQYQYYSILSSLKDRFDFLLEAEPQDFRFYYKKEYFVRDSEYDQFNYWDDDNMAGIQWNPAGPWNYEIEGKYFSRQYYSAAATIQTENFVDQGVLTGIGREIDERISIKLEGSYNNRQFNRWAVTETAPIPGSLQTDETWSVLFNAHLYLENILQDFNLEQQRTNSNSYGFSNTVQSASWAAVVRPSSSVYLQLLFRFFSKVYDVQPLTNSLLNIGFIDEDSQDLLSVKATWDWAPQWSASLGASRFRNEYIQPGQYYIEDLLTATVQKDF